jgi:hypothetical protein
MRPKGNETVRQPSNSEGFFMSEDTADPPSSSERRLLIDELLTERIAQLRLKKSEVVRRWGYSNIGKGLRRLDQLRVGSFLLDEKLLSRLAAAVELPEPAIKDAIAATQYKLEQEEKGAKYREWLAWCARFKPHAILRTERKIPSPIFVVAFVGAENILRLDFDYTKPQDQWVEEVISKLPQDVIAFGKVTGFFINYAPNRMVEYDHDGTPVQELPEAKRPGRASMVHINRYRLDQLKSRQHLRNRAYCMAVFDVPNWGLGYQGANNDTINPCQCIHDTGVHGYGAG